MFSKIRLHTTNPPKPAFPYIYIYILLLLDSLFTLPYILKSGCETFRNRIFTFQPILKVTSFINPTILMFGGVVRMIRAVVKMFGGAKNTLRGSW